MKNLLKLFILFLFGGLSYITVEFLYRGYSHISMFILGGILFIEIGLFNEITKKRFGLLYQGLLGSFIITLSELIAGIILNIWLKLDVWDYSMLPFNVLGQISLIYSVIWIFISVLAVILDDFLRFLLFKEDFPKYTILKKDS